MELICDLEFDKTVFLVLHLQRGQTVFSFNEKKWLQNAALKHEISGLTGRKQIPLVSERVESPGNRVLLMLYPSLSV